eukprot:26724-Pelagococcus_subviridis.AAC.2
MCPTEAAGKIIGHGGDTINSIQAKSGAHVKIQPSHEVVPGQPRRITISGVPGAVADAAQLVNDIIRETELKHSRASLPGGGGGGHSGGGRDSNQIEMPVPVPTEMIGRVIGRGGETIRRLQEESGARMQVERDLGRVMIKGGADECTRAKELVLDILNAPPPTAGGGGGGGGTVRHVMPAGGCEGKIIGKGGDSIRDLCARTGAKIQIDKDAASVTISGRQDQVDAAIALVQAIIDEGPTVYMKPGGLPGEDPRPYEPGLGRGGGGGTGGYAAASAGADGGDGAKPLWEAHKSPEGYTYYYNTIDGSTTWDMPADYDGKS